MIFWILIALAVIAIIGTYIYWGMEDDWLWAFLPSLLAVILSAGIGAGLLGLSLLI